ncbi:MAG TPA: hypothetical protein EYN74_01285 [Nitrospirales bacterium]|nr:hypothetical protein [Nitrospirales bacterium]HIN34090.1 hypothetical protein [Nitrospirales bacterium]
MTSHELVIQFLTSIGRPDEAEFYLKLFKSESPERFAIIVVGESVMEEASEVLAADLRFLAQLQLTPIVVFGLVKPSTSGRHANTVRERLEPHVRCSIVSVEDPSHVQAVVHDGSVALLPFPESAETIDDRFDLLADLAQFLRSRKIMFLGTRSGLQTPDGTVLSLVDMTTEFEELVMPNRLPLHQQALLQQVNRLFKTIDCQTTIAVTSPLDLLRELFTSTGAGTLIRLGSSITHVTDITHVDCSRLQTLIETAFGRTLVDDFFARPMHALYLADDYRGTAIIADTPVGKYLTKFAVDRQARGEGVGHDLWRVLYANCPQVFWRSRANNPLIAWYEQQCDGMIRDEAWHVFWRGLQPEDIPRAIDYARHAPIDFRP